MRTPLQAPAKVDVLPIDCTGRAAMPSSADVFTYLAPKIASVAPTSGTIGTVVSIKGTNLTNGCTGGASAPLVQFGATTIAPGDSRYVSATATLVRVVAPSAPAGKVELRVRDCLGETTAPVTADKFTYVPPKVTAMAPTSGHAGTVVTVKGTGFLTGCTGGALPAVAFGTTVVAGTDASVSSVSATAIKLAAPAHAAGTVDVRVVDCVGDVTAVTYVDRFRYL
jgi:hypothetical protein